MAAAGSDWVELVQVREPARLGLLQSLLDSAGIEYRVEGEAVQGLFPVTTPGFFHHRGLSAVIHVRPEDLEDARELLETGAGDELEAEL
jgi:hypothetical protein